MPRRPKLEPPNADQLNALLEYSSWCNARGEDDWKACLSSDWLRAGTEWRSETSGYGYLQQLRNEPTFGPRGLAAFELPKQIGDTAGIREVEHRRTMQDGVDARIAEGLRSAKYSIT